MDMNASYELEVKAHCPQAEIVFDLFHVAAKYGREVMIGCASIRPTRCARIAARARW
jgi:transposase